MKEEKLIHRRSRESKQRRKQERIEQEKRKNDYKIANGIVLDFSWQDQVTREKVFTDVPCGEDKKGNRYTFKILLEEKLIAKFGFTPEHALNHELGESLNRFGP